MAVAVSIISMNRGPILMQTINAAGQVDPNLLIVDNASTDAGTLAILEGRRVIRNATNLGLSVAVNQGLNLSDPQADVLMHLDDDALIDAPHTVAGTLAAAFGSYPELGLVLPNPHNYTEYIDRGGYREIRWGLGFCWAMRTSLYREIGGYDRQLLHQQECDLALRTRMAGYTVGALPGFSAQHNDPGVHAPRSDASQAREHLGCVQFRDKWTRYFRGNSAPGTPWSYGTMPLYLMQHWPPDQEWYRRFAEANGVVLNAPPPPGTYLPPGTVLSVTALDQIPRLVEIRGLQYLVYADLRNDYGYWATGPGYLEDRDKAIARWRDLTGETYSGYRWPSQGANV